ncbi:arylsulfotransferase family protein [Conexibacter sp. JD483]|uniref:arylsulfotransferase family protein n=1 Tax=unclassified Conexibacter TaxID=2627773 RepID=UPI00271C6087|nr:MULTISPECIES: arylsulfotransferase family protein [unclassified Conexibacter]MDO8189014.1 arylsulfotransferase family protein [Conexibacter sp. CPCC 205706]MDO8201414.1 arylsulfotransferase family protein [Conexibacter sp. CPCC 205762]MDR9371699.1 arylsulfotransferase family protein [Conexibacter sp. JD483]
MIKQLLAVAGVAAALPAAAQAAAAPVPAVPSARAAQAAPVSAYPSPGARTVEAGAQLSLRGVAPAAVGPLEVTGSRSGRHDGRLVAHPDGDGASFVPERPFTAGESVTVRTTLNVAGARNGDFGWTIATPGPPLRAMAIPPATLSGSGVARFHSRHDLVPPRVVVKAARGARTAPGSLFLGLFSAPYQHGPGQIGPMIVDASGRMVWFHPLGDDQLALDVRVQQYAGRPVVTWWQGVNNLGLGSGVGEIYDSSYRAVATVHAGNGLSADLHEFLLTPRGTALLAAATPVVWDASAAGGSRRAVVYDDVVQEVDVSSGLVLFEWHSLDHVGVAESHIRAPRVDGHLYDYFHLNSIGELPGGDLLISARNTWGVYRVARASGDVDWRLGGTRSSFRAGAGASFSWQHDARATADGTITVFDDGPTPGAGKQSRAIGLRLDLRRRTVRLVHQWSHAPTLLAGTQGNVQTLPGGDALVGWGSQPHLTEFAPHGAPLLEATYPRGVESYRAYRFPWSATPDSQPDVAASAAPGGRMRVYASWNGATAVARWQLLGGTSEADLKPLATAGVRSFETLLQAPATAVVAVRALAADGTVLATSRLAAVRPA